MGTPARAADTDTNIAMLSIENTTVPMSWEHYCTIPDQAGYSAIAAWHEIAGSAPNLIALLLGSNLLVPRSLAYRAEVEPGLEVGQIVEHVWQQEVQQTPQLAQVVLQGGACKQSGWFESLSLSVEAA